MPRFCSLTPLVPYDQMTSPIDWSSHFDEDLPLELEIGFGQGEVLVRKAFEHPDRNFIGIEMNWQRIYKTMSTLTRLQSRRPDALRNVRILDIDAEFALEYFFEQQSLDHVYVLFPCPWPKKTHARHRLFSGDFLRLLNSRLRPEAEVQLVTDFKPYQEWVLEQTADTGFSVETRDIRPRFETKFERKWKSKGQDVFFETIFRKVQHHSQDVKEFLELKSYRLEHFDPERFAFEDLKGPVSVIFKDMIYDQRRQRAEVYVLVAEQHINQPIRVMIQKKDDYWRVCKADGQMFFPTSSVSLAIDLVYQAAVRSAENNVNPL